MKRSNFPGARNVRRAKVLERMKNYKFDKRKNKELSEEEWRKQNMKEMEKLRNKLK